MVIRFLACVFSVFLITACGGSGSNPDNELAETSNLSSALSSSFALSSSPTTSSPLSVSSSSVSSQLVSSSASSSGSAASRQKINPSEANFFQESGLWLTFTKIDSRRRLPQNNVQKPFVEERLFETSVNTYVFAPQSDEMAPGECVRTLNAEQVSGGFRPLFFYHPIGAELYCITDDQLFLENDGSYTVEYHCENKILATTRMVKISSLPEYQDLGLTISGAEHQQPACANWNISNFERWSLDADGNEIEREVQASLFNGIQLRIGTDEESLVIEFTNNINTWSAGIYSLDWPILMEPQLSESILAEVTTANAGINSVVGKHFSAVEGELQLDRIEPLRMSGSFEMESSVNTNISGSFSFDVSEYFPE